MTADNTDRTTALRQALVDAVNDSTRTARPRWQLVSFVAAIALVSGATGAVSAAALTNSAPVNDAPSNEIVATMALSVARPLSEPAGQPHYVESNGTVTVDLGSAPEGATGVAIRTHCTETGSVDVTLDGRFLHGHTCSAGRGGGGGFEAIADEESHFLTFTSPTRTGYKSFISWIIEPPLPKVSAEQLAELADGIVSRSEYLAAFHRYVGCMSGAGFELINLNVDLEVIDYWITEDAVASGADEKCYGSQYEQVNMAWQLQVEAAG